MKKILTLALAAAFTVAAYSPASAVDVKVDGEYLLQFQTGSLGFHGDNEDSMQQRVRLGLTFSASEELSGYFQTESVWEWGINSDDPTEPNGMGFDGTGVNIGMRQAYIDWTVPNTNIKVRMGRHAFDLPSYASTSPIIADLVADGVVVDVPFNDTYSLTAFWTRMARGLGTDTTTPKYDLFGAVANASFDSLTVTPWAVYGVKGKNNEDFEPEMDAQGNITGEGHADILVLGGGLEWKPFDPVTLAMDAGYGRTSYSQDKNQEGWFAVGKAAYSLDFGEPTLMAWYASGDKKGRAANSGQVPVIFGDFDGTSTYFDAAWGIFGGNRCSFGGTWGVSAQLNGVSFLENLSHDFSVTYFSGTNNKDNIGEDYGDGYDYLTSKDSGVEFNILSTYDIYKNLTAALELAYIVEDFDDDRREESYKNDWRVALHFKYAF